MRRALIVLLFLAAAWLVWLALDTTGGSPETVRGGGHDARTADDAARLEGLGVAQASSRGQRSSPGDAAHPGATSSRSWRTTGSVVEKATGAPIPGAILRFALIRGGDALALGEAETDDEGRFALELPQLGRLSAAQLAPSRLVAWIWADGWVRAAGRARANYKQVDLKPLLDAREVTWAFQMKRGFAYWGRVVNAKGHPVYRARVDFRTITAGDRPSSWGTCCWSDPQGCWWWSGRQHLQRSDETEYAFRAWQNGSGFSEPIFVPGRAGAVPDLLPDLVLGTSRGTIEGVVQFPDGTPVALVPVRALISSRGVGRTGSRTLTDAQGRFALRGLEPGTARVEVLRTRPPRPRITPTEKAILEVDVGERNVLVEVPRPRVHLRLVDAWGKPVFGVDYTARLSGGGPPARQEGHVNQSEAKSSIWAEPGDHVAIGVGDENLLPVETVVHVPRGVWTQEVAIVVEANVASARGRVRIVARYADGTPVPHLTASMRTPQADHVVDHRRFRSSDPRPWTWDVPAGTWKIELSPSKSSDGWASEAHEVTVRPGAETLLETTVSVGGRIRLHVQTPPWPRGHPRAHAEVVSEEGRIAPRLQSLGHRRTTEWMLPPGPYAVAAWAHDCDLVRERVKVTDGETVDVYLVLAPR